jgi:hypothetical protein
MRDHSSGRTPVFAQERQIAGIIFSLLKRVLLSLMSNTFELLNGYPCYRFPEKELRLYISVVDFVAETYFRGFRYTQVPTVLPFSESILYTTSSEHGFFIVFL